MHVINARNVNYAFVKGLRYLREQGVRQESRNGPVLVSPVPVATVYARPWERVLFNNGSRRPNPIFHLMESLWMLAGRWDAPWLDQFVHDFSARFGEKDMDGNQHGAYGKRWRDWFHDEDYETRVDQLGWAVERLRDDPNDRRVVIQMWDPTWDRDPELKDVPCNLTLLPRLRHSDAAGGPVLDITVFCRSNDLVWGAYGANAVHFSFLQEYLAARLGTAIGTYTQISNNFHVYEATMPTGVEVARDLYNQTELIRIPLIVSELFDEELRIWMNHPVGKERGYDDWDNVFFNDVATPVWNVNLARKAKNKPDAIAWCSNIADDAWRIATGEWLAGLKWE